MNKSVNKFVVFLGSFFLLSALFPPDALSQKILIYEPWETVALEHADRVNRLKRIARAMGTKQPEFFEYSVPQERHQLPDFPVDIPVLRVVYPEDVFFSSDSSKLTEDAVRVIDNVAASLWKEPADVTVFIVGHTDSRGSERYNLQLGNQRAQSVAKDFAYRRVPQSQIYRVSFGEFAPVASNETQDGRARNRRVEFLFSARPEPIAIWLLEEQQNILEVRAARSPVNTPNHTPSTGGTDRTEPESLTREEKNQSIDRANPKTTAKFESEHISNIHGTASPQHTDINPSETETVEIVDKQSRQTFNEDTHDITIEAESVEVALNSEEKTVLDVGRKKVVLNLTQKKLNLITR